MALHAGHGLTYRNVVPVAAIEGMHELNIGHSIIARALMVGLERGRAGNEANWWRVSVHGAGGWSIFGLSGLVPSRKRRLSHPPSPPTPNLAHPMSTRAKILPAFPWPWSPPSATGRSMWRPCSGRSSSRSTPARRASARSAPTGESPTLSHAEHERVIAAVVEAAARPDQGHGRHRLQQHRRGPAADAAGRPSAGADAALVVTPYYNKPTQEGFYQHFKALAEAVDIPICIYNIPGRTGTNIEPETIARMAELPNITMVKEATGSMDQASQILALTDLTVLSGDDSLTLPLLAIGGRGVVSVVGNIVPRDVIAMISAFDAGHVDEARRWHHKLFPLCRDMLGLSTNPIPIKAAMKLLGRDTGDLRMPLTPLSPEQQCKLHGTLARYGLLEVRAGH